MMTRFKGLLTLSALALCVGLISISSQASSASEDPTPDEIAAARSVWQLMGDEHYAYLIRPRDEKLALKVIQAYLDHLDPEHLVFRAEDVEKFRAKPLWALAAMQGRAMVAPFKIHDIYEQRIQERQAWLAQWVPTVAYARGASWQVDREKLPWPSSEDEQNRLWQKYLDSAYLQDGADEKAQKKIAATQKMALQRAASQPRFEVMESFVNSFAQTVDPHASYMIPASAEDLAINLSLSLDGIGTTLAEKDDGVFVEQVLPGGPAAKSGQVGVGDKIMAVSNPSGQWVDAENMRSEDVVALVRGKAGTVVRLRLAKKGDEALKKEVSLTRERIVLKESGAKEQILEKNGKKVGWIRLPGFYGDWRHDGKASASATRDVEAALVRLKKAQVDSVILDLRDNGGGSLNEAVGLVGLFMPPSDVVQILDADEKLTQMRSPQAKPVWTGPLAVLTNRGSASASEIAAGALQDHGRALVIGEQTFGKGTVQSVIDLDEIWGNSAPTLGQMKMTVAQFFLPSGRSTQLKGVVPNVNLKATLGPMEGEEQYENAAPAATVPAVKGLEGRPAWITQVKELQVEADQAAHASEDYRAWLALRNEILVRSQRKTAPLNPLDNTQLREKDEQWREKAEAEMKRLGVSEENRADPVVQVAVDVVSHWIN